MTYKERGYEMTLFGISYGPTTTREYKIQKKLEYRDAATMSLSPPRVK